MDFSSYLQESAVQIDRFLDKFLTEWVQEISKVSPKLTKLAQVFAETCRGGKRIRGTLVVLGFQLAAHLPGVRAHLEGEIVKIAVAYEIFHAAILAHDDIIDQSPTRRGQPSLYKRVGVEQAITLADGGFFLAIKIIAESNFEDKLKNQALRFFAQTMVDTAIGQMLDVSHVDPELTAKLKTARYTISGPLKLGAILAGAESDSAGAEEHLIRILGDFGEAAGVAFQIRDDILDGEVESIDKAEAKALKYAFAAKRAIPKITSDSKMRKLFSDMVQYMVERSK